MKKIMIAAAIACAAVAAQAATVNWNTGGTIKPDGSTSAANKTLEIFVWTVANQTAYDAISLESIWSTYGNTKLSEMEKTAVAYKGELGGAMGGKAAIDDVANGTTLYGVIITAYDKNLDGTVDMYAVNKAIGSVSEIGGVTSPTGLAKFVGGGTSGTAVKWEAAAVPEPTSGLLLLLGMAGLALRRRRT